jgi:hypothetical protein
MWMKNGNSYAQIFLFMRGSYLSNGVFFMELMFNMLCFIEVFFFN